MQNASGTDFHGYHAMDMSSVDLRYESRTKWGSSEDVKFQDLIDKAHAKGLKIILDVVLQHTGNFGEVNLNPLFTRSQNIKDQASVSACLIPNSERLSNNYFDQGRNYSMQSVSSISRIRNMTSITTIITTEQVGTGTCQTVGGDRLQAIA